jgi:hypothetical protein
MVSVVQQAVGNVFVPVYVRTTGSTINRTDVYAVFTRSITAAPLRAQTIAWCTTAPLAPDTLQRASDNAACVMERRIPGWTCWRAATANRAETHFLTRMSTVSKACEEGTDCGERDVDALDRCWQTMRCSIRRCAHAAARTAVDDDDLRLPYGARQRRSATCGDHWRARSRAEFIVVVDAIEINGIDLIR